MSGHSHWSTIKHQKEAADKKRGKLFSKISRIITIAAKQGKDIQANPGLRLAVDQAKKANMPNENIERAIKKGAGELAGESLEEFCFEAYGPEKSAIIITGITDNKNRALHQIKQILSLNGAKMAEEGAVKWQFEQVGIILVPKKEPKEDLELLAIESGAEDVSWLDDFLEIYTKPENLEQAKKQLEDNDIEIESTSLGWYSKEKISLDQRNQEKVEKLFFALDDNDDVQQIYSNIKI